MAEHTPGPWTTRKATRGIGLAFTIRREDKPGGPPIGYVPSLVQGEIAHTSTAPSWKVVEANARLIAASPDLLAACKALVKADEQACNATDFAIRTTDALVIARAAIRKATATD